MNFMLDCDVEVYFRIYRGDAYNVPKGVCIDYGDPEYDHYYDASGTVIVSVKGILGMRYPEIEISEMKVQLLEPNDLVIDDISDIEVVEGSDGSIFR